MDCSNVLQEKESAIERWHEAEQEIDRLQQQLQVIRGWGVCQSILFLFGGVGQRIPFRLGSLPKNIF